MLRLLLIKTVNLEVLVSMKASAHATVLRSNIPDKCTDPYVSSFSIEILLCDRYYGAVQEQSLLDTFTS